MLDMRPNCEACNSDLPADTPDAMICSLECTWCETCAREFVVCPNCKGELRPRPTRVGRYLEKYPTSTMRVLSKVRALET